MNSTMLCRLGRLVAVPALALVWVMAGGGDVLARDTDRGPYIDPVGGFTGPGPETSSVESVKNMRDDTRVALKGHIVQNLGGNDYVFRDETGTIQVEISDRRWRGQRISPDDMVEIHGEVDHDDGRVSVDVKRLIKSQ